MRQTEQNVSSMSNEGRNAYVVEHLTDALLRLLEEKTMSEISVSELVDAAGVGRASFYRNFECKEDILKRYLDRKVHEWMDNWDNALPLSEQIRRMIAHFEANRSFYTLLNDRGLTYLLKDVMIGLRGPKPEDDKVQAYATAFFAYALYGWIETWFQRGMKESADEMAELFKAQGL